MEEVAAPGLPRSARIQLALQRAVCLLLSPLTLSATALGLRGLLRLRFPDLAALRQAYRRDRSQGGPLLICANHLTMVDSFLIAYALGAPSWYFFHPRAVPWNVPDRSVFAARPWQRGLIYTVKCLPIERGGRRASVASTLARFAHLLRGGEVGMVFPEGGRSRTGRVDVDSAAWGVGRVVRATGCRVLCVYLRGDSQRGHGTLPARGDTIRARARFFEPKTELRGVRASREISRQILTHLSEMEAEHFAAA